MKIQFSNQRNRSDRPDYFNLSYGIASAQISATSFAVATTQAAFIGMQIISATSPATVTVYDNTGTATGPILALMSIAVTSSTGSEKFLPIIAKKGIYVVATGTGVQGSIFYGPRG